MRYAWSIFPHPHRSARRLAPALLLSITLVAAMPVAAKPHPHPSADASVIATWNEVAVTTVTAAGASPTAFNYFAFVHLAMYNAVVAITGEYELYKWDGVAPKPASPEAAAAAAAHRVLENYFGDSAARDLQLAASLANVRNKVARANGEAFGVLAANHIIGLRVNDGRGATVTEPTQGTQPGQWRPTPGGAVPFAPFSTAWLGGVKPLALDSHDRFDPGEPPAIDSETYFDEFEEVRITGALNAPVEDRSDAMEQTARFFSDAGIVPMQRALQGFALRRGLDIDDSARMFAAVETAIADGAGTVWNAKLQYLWWRPVTAIQMADTDGNDDTVGVPTWMPFIGTPPYPDWPSGLCSVVGATSTVLTRLNGDGSLDLTITSAAAGETRNFATKAEIADQAVDARVWSGIHFRTADEVSIDIGSDVANYVLDHYFQPTD